MVTKSRVFLAYAIPATGARVLVGHPAYGTETLRTDLHRFVFLLGLSDGEELSGEPTP